MEQATRKKRAIPTLRGYLFGVDAAATYLGVDRKTFRGWRDDPAMPHSELLRPRIIRSNSFYCIRKLDKFMDPDRNAPGDAIQDHFLSGSEKQN